MASLFCGCGGSDLGMVGGFEYLLRRYAQLPFEIVYAVDNDRRTVETYNANFPHSAECADVRTVDYKLLGDVEVLIGGFPCQSFSTVNPTKDTNDLRANLYKEIVRFLQTKGPSFFICEDVKGLLTLKKGAIIEKIAREFSGVGYRVFYQLLNSADFRVPQKRERVFIVGVRNDLKVDFHFPQTRLLPSQYVPLSAVIKNLELEEKKYYFSKRAVEGMKRPKNNMKRGLWQNLAGPCLTITSHLAKTGINSRDPVLLVDAEREIYRRFTPREAARMQSFPENFVFSVSDTFAYKQIGNAVPPVMMWHIAKALSEIAIGEPGKKENAVSLSRCK